MIVPVDYRVRSTGVHPNVLTLIRLHLVYAVHIYFFTSLQITKSVTTCGPALYVGRCVGWLASARPFVRPSVCLSLSLSLSLDRSSTGTLERYSNDLGQCCRRECGVRWAARDAVFKAACLLCVLQYSDKIWSNQILKLSEVWQQFVNSELADSAPTARSSRVQVAGVRIILIGL